MNRDEGLQLARRFKRLLLRRGYPVRQVLLYGSVAKGTAGPNSDIDIAVVTAPFHPSRVREGGDILLLSKDIDLRIETICLTGGGRLDPDTYASRGSYLAATLAAGAGLTAVRALQEGRGDAAFCAVRPLYMRRVSFTHSTAFEKRSGK